MHTQSRGQLVHVQNLPTAPSWLLARRVSSGATGPRHTPAPTQGSSKAFKDEILVSKRC